MTDPAFIIAAVTAFVSAVSAVAAIGMMVGANRDRAAQAAADERHHAEAMAPPSTN